MRVHPFQRSLGLFGTVVCLGLASCSSGGGDGSDAGFDAFEQVDAHKQSDAHKQGDANKQGDAKPADGAFKDVGTVDSQVTPEAGKDVRAPEASTDTGAQPDSGAADAGHDATRDATTDAKPDAADGSKDASADVTDGSKDAAEAAPPDLCVGVTCQPLDQCHAIGTCDSATGKCSNPLATDGTTCDDGNACTSIDICTAGACGGTSYSCSPTNCQASATCDGQGGCTIVNVPAGNACADDGNPCTTDRCDASGTCAHPNAADGTSCGAGLVCSTGSCLAECEIGGTLYPAGTINPANPCQVCSPPTSTTDWSNAGVGATCDDGNGCTTGDACDGNGACVGTGCAAGLTCAGSLSAFQGTQTPGFIFNGDAYYDSTTNTAVLVDGSTTNGQAGTALYQDRVTVDAFSVSFTFTLSTPNGRADGLTFVMETNGNAAVGSAYGGLGAMNLTGYAVELDDFDSSPCEFPEQMGGSFNGNHAGIDGLTPCPLNPGIPSPIATSGDLFASNFGDIADGKPHNAKIDIVSGQVSVSLSDVDGILQPVDALQSVSLPGYVAGTPYFVGFSGGSGSNGQGGRAEIGDVLVTFGTNQCL